VAVAAGGVLLTWWGATPSQAYVEAPYTLGRVCHESSNIMIVRVERVDKQANVIVYRKVQDLKGKHPTDVIQHNIGRGGFNPREWQYPMEWAEVGKTAIFFHNGGASETCIGTYWYQAYGGGQNWGLSHGEPFLLRSFSGKPEKLAAAVTAIVAGQEVVVTCMVDGNKDDLHLRRAKIQRLRNSLKLLDYNPKRDFVGWGGMEDFRWLYGMPGFTRYSGLPRVDPEAQAISAVDIDGDGKPDLCLVGGGKVALVQNAGESFNEVSLAGVGGCRSAVWADYNGDGRPDLLLATPTGPKLFTNLGGGAFRDDSHLLPKEACYNLTAAAWIDYDGDGHPDILLGNGFHGLRLYRNLFPPSRIPKIVADLDSNDFAVREKATAELDKLGPVAEGALRKVLENKPTLEVRRRIEQRIEVWRLQAKNPPKAGVQPTVLHAPWFEDVSVQVGLGPDGIGGTIKGDTLTVCDVNMDGRPDFLYGAGTGVLVLNTPKGFVEVKDSGISYKPGKVGPVFGDFLGDGHPGLFVPQLDGRCKLFRNDGKGRFTDVTAMAGDLAKPLGMATCAAWGDFFNSGRRDLVVGCLRGPNRLFHNLGGGKFEDATEKVGLNQKIFNTQAVCFVDLNNDGMLDVVFNNEGQEPCILMGNPAIAQKRTPVSLQIAGSGGVIGSRVQVLDKQGKFLSGHYISGGDGRGGQRSPVARFALAPGTYRVVVRYSSGLERAKDITVDGTHLRDTIDDQTPRRE
jgi:hypothetical protein